MTGHQLTGWHRREFFDDRDKYYVPKTYFDLSKMVPLNLQTHGKYGAYFSEVYNQGPPTTLNGYCWGTCTAERHRSRPLRTSASVKVSQTSSPPDSSSTLTPGS